MSNLVKADGCYFVDCPVCGKRKLLSYTVNINKYFYKIRKGKDWTYYCSYTCYRVAEQRKKIGNTLYDNNLKKFVKPRKPRKQRVLGEQALTNLAARREQNLNMGKTFWDDWCAGISQMKIAKKYDVSKSFVQKWLKKYREVMA